MTANERILKVAAGLISEQGENTEYDRAIAEMTCELLDISTEHKGVVLSVLQAL